MWKSKEVSFNVTVSHYSSSSCPSTTWAGCWLNSNDEGYNLSPKGQEVPKIEHLLYIDDFKLYASNENMLKHQLNTVKKFSTDIYRKFELNKCATVSIEKGKLKRRKE